MAVMSVQSLFNFVTDQSINDDNIEEYLSKAEEIALDGQGDEELEVDFFDFLNGQNPTFL